MVQKDLWKSVENVGGLRLRKSKGCSEEASACSNCAGDYEDPERTAETREAQEQEEAGDEKQ